MKLVYKLPERTLKRQNSYVKHIIWQGLLPLYFNKNNRRKGKKEMNF